MVWAPTRYLDGRRRAIEAFLVGLRGREGEELRRMPGITGHSQVGTFFGNKTGASLLLFGLVCTLACVVLLPLFCLLCVVLGLFVFVFSFPGRSRQLWAARNNGVQCQLHAC